jgi:hypothetical protein
MDCEIEIKVRVVFEANKGRSDRGSGQENGMGKRSFIYMWRCSRLSGDLSPEIVGSS